MAANIQRPYLFFGTLVLAILCVHSQTPALAPIDATETSATDVNALKTLRTRFSYTASQIRQLRWNTTSDVCGTQTCPVGSCTWNGIACRNYRVIGVDISAAVVTADPQLLNGILPTELAEIDSLEFLNFSGHSIGGELPADWGALTKLQSLDVSSNGLTGSLPASWGNLTSITTMDLSQNRLQGAVPQAWAQLPRLQTLNVSRNNVCRSSVMPNSTQVQNDSPQLCSNQQLFAANTPVLAPAASSGSSQAVGPSPPPPTSSSTFTPSPQPILQMSTGINIAVSVVIGAFLLFGIVAGAIRVRRQQNAHASWLRARAEAMWRAEREEDEAFRRHLKQLKDPSLAIDPDGSTITLALLVDAAATNVDDTDGPRDGGSGEGGVGGFPTVSTQPLDGDSQTREPTETNAQPRSAGSVNAPSVQSGGYRARQESLRRDAHGRPGRRVRRLPMFVIDAYFTPSGRITFVEEEKHWADSERRLHTGVPIAEEPTTAPSGSGIGGGIRSLWTNLRGQREPQSDIERPPLEAPPAHAQPAAQSFTGQQREASADLQGARTSLEPSVAARVRNRIDELREPGDEAPSSLAAESGPAPPPPVIRWGPLRRFFGMEDVATRDARLRRQALQALRDESRANRSRRARGAMQ